MIFTLGLWMAMACVAVDGDRIRARDLAAAVPAFAAMPPEAELGYSPAPGVRRVFHSAELGRLASREGVATTGGMPDVCVERPTAPLSIGALLAALATAVGDPDARIEVLDWSRYPVPKGQIEFPRAGVFAEGTGPEAAVLWKGLVKYGDRGRFSIWVRARIQVPAAQVTAREMLPASRPIQPGQLQLATGVLSPFGPQPVRTLAEVVGCAPRRQVPAGSPIFMNQLEVPLAIHSGDPVTVRVTSGRARLALDGVAGADGRRGDLIPVRNPASGRTFRARVEGAGLVAIVVRYDERQQPQEEK
jgi:flagella basal body P-ring formation protein FlgA